MRRTDVSFSSEGILCRGWLYTPDSGTPGPCIVMAHGLGGVKEMRLDAYAERFAEEGYRVLVFDYRGFGASDGEPRRVVDVARQHDDWRAAIAFARIQPGVDAGRTVLWGTSLSGGHVLAIASERPEIAAVIAQVPHVDARAAFEASRAAGWARLALHGVWDRALGLVGLAPHDVPAAAEPGALAFMNAPEAVGYLRLVPEGFAFDPSMAARSVFSLMGYSPGRSAHRIRVPTLVQVALRDQTTPAAAATSVVERITLGELRTYDTDHFSPYLGETFEAFVADQIAFLRRHVPVLSS
jgi:dienelactone hydrolase